MRSSYFVKHSGDFLVIKFLIKLSESIVVQGYENAKNTLTFLAK